MIKMIITDVDDTLVPESSSVINPEYYDIIRKFREKGILFGVASGRQKPSVQNLFRPVVDELFILGDNGTDIWMQGRQESISFPEELYPEVVEELHRVAPEYSLMASKPDLTYFEYGHEEFYSHMQKYAYIGEYTEDMKALKGICKLSAWIKTGIEPELIENQKKRWEGMLDVCLAGETFLDFTGMGANKGKALSIVQEHYGIKPEETVAFGNANNDISMLNRAKYSYAVAGATDELKKAASAVIGEMRDDAVLEKLKEILNSL